MQLGDSDPKCCNYANGLCKHAKFPVLYGYHSHSMTNNKLKPSKCFPSESYRHKLKSHPLFPQYMFFHVSSQHQCMNVSHISAIRACIFYGACECRWSHRMIVSSVYHTGWHHLLVLKNKLVPAFSLPSCVMCAPGWGTDYITLHTAASLTADTHTYWWSERRANTWCCCMQMHHFIKQLHLLPFMNEPIILYICASTSYIIYRKGFCEPLGFFLRELQRFRDFCVKSNIKITI